MRNDKTGGPAFPTVDANDFQDYGTRGMTLRDYFAAKALPVCLEMGHALAAHRGTDLSREEFKVVLAGDAYAWADAMLKARDEVKP